LRESIKHQWWDVREWQFLVLSVTVCSEPSEIRPKIIFYSDTNPKIDDLGWP